MNRIWSGSLLKTGENSSVESAGRGGPESAAASDETAPSRSRLGTGSWGFMSSHVPEGHVGLLARAARKSRLRAKRLTQPRPGITFRDAGWQFLVFLLFFLVIAGHPASAHNGPPFPIIEGRRIGPCVVALWTHPDVGIGTFFVILDAPPGGRIPNDLKVDIGIQPVSGRLPEVRYAARREELRGQVQYKTEVNFDADELWRVRLSIRSSQGAGEAMATVEATPPGLGAWDLLWYVSPFLGAGFLWFRALTRKRRRRRGVSALRSTDSVRKPVDSDPKMIGS